MHLPSSYVLPNARRSSLLIEDIENRPLQAQIVELLQIVDLEVQVQDDLILVSAVGGEHGNRSVTIVLDLVEIKGCFTLLIQAFIAEAPPGAKLTASAMAGVIAASAVFGGVQVRQPESGPEQLWLVVPMMASGRMSPDHLVDAINLLADEADFLDDITVQSWT